MVRAAVGLVNKVKEFRENIFSLAEKEDPCVWQSASLKDVKKVVLIQSSPRSGSSLLFSILKRLPGIYSLSGECVPFYKLNGLSSDNFASDEIPQDLKSARQTFAGMSRDFLSDCSVAQKEDILHSREAQKQYINELALRFSMQWPDVDFSYDIFVKLAKEALDDYLKTCREFSTADFYLQLLKSLRTIYKQINPYYYDIPEQVIKKHFSSRSIPQGPPNDSLVIEEPPFILLSPNKKVERKDLEDKVLLLKSTVNCYRMDYIRDLLPNVEMKLIYLTRNPLSSVNGLYDGWLFRGFFSHKLKNLRIVGYSDKYAWGKSWWKYDLPRGWQDHASKKLEEVCAFQWLSANQAIRSDLQENKTKFIRVCYEDLVENSGSFKEALSGIARFIGLPAEESKGLEFKKLSMVQATKPPRPQRWKEKKEILLPLLKDAGISGMSEALGYDTEKLGSWR